MSNDDVLDLVRQCDLQKGNVLVPGEAYWFKQAFQIRVSGSIRYEEEIIVLVWHGVEVGGIYRMGFEDIYG